MAAGMHQAPAAAHMTETSTRSPGQRLLRPCTHKTSTPKAAAVPGFGGRWLGARARRARLRPKGAPRCIENKQRAPANANGLSPLLRQSNQPSKPPFPKNARDPNQDWGAFARFSSAKPAAMMTLGSTDESLGEGTTQAGRFSWFSYSARAKCRPAHNNDRFPPTTLPIDRGAPESIPVACTW